MKRKNIAILYGGEGREHNISLKSAKFLLSVIDRERYNPIPVLITRSGAWRSAGRRYSLLYPRRVGGRGVLSGRDFSIPIDCAIPLLHGDFGEDGRVQGALDVAGIRYVGCTPVAGAVASDKILTKAVADSLGIPTVRSLFSIDEPPEVAKFRAESFIGYPMFIKPSDLGSSVGCGEAMLPADFDGAYAGARAVSRRILIEEYLEGARELECAYLGAGGRELFAHPGEVLASGFYSYDKKYRRNSDAVAVTSAPLDEATLTRITDYSRRLVHAIGIRHLARIDFFLREGEVILNEINTMPGFTASSLYPKMIAAEGIAPTELVSELIEEASC